MKKKSEQAKRDESRVLVIQNANSTKRKVEKAYSDLFYEHNKQLKIFFLKKIKGDVDTSEDLVIDTFKKVCENISLFNKDKGAFSTWLYKIATNNLIDFTRKTTIELFSYDAVFDANDGSENEMNYQIISPDFNPQEVISNTALGLEISDAIYSLKDSFVRDIMIKLYIKELTFKEINAELGLEENCSTPRVGALRGKKMLANKLEHLRKY